MNKEAKKLYEEAIKTLEGNPTPKQRQTAIAKIQKAADLGLPEAMDWIDDYGFDDDAFVQAES